MLTPSPAPVRVTCHAVRRYAERRLGVYVVAETDRAALPELAKRGVDLQAIERTLLRLGATAKAFGAPAIISGKIRVVVENDAVVTVTPKGGVY